MQTLSVELDEETLQALEVERSLIGFESRDAYVRWIIAHRTAIDHETEMGDVLDAYSDRITSLEARLESIESEQSSVAASSSGAASITAGSEIDTPSETDGNAGDAVAERQASDDQQPATSDGGWTSRSAAGGSGQSLGEAQPASEAPSSAGTSSSTEDSTLGEKTAAEADICAKNLRPERVERVKDDRLSDDAGVLGTVEVDRLDELSRRAVAKTRKQLDRNVETGLEYRSSTPLAETSGDVRAGEDVIDLESIAVPGQSSDLIEQRQELIGVALAHLRDEGSAKKGDFVDALYEEYPAGYGSPGGWWRCLKKGLKQVERVEGGDGSRIWRLTE